MPEAIQRLLFLLLTFQTSGILSAQGNCRLPDTWKGKWFQSGVQQPIVISTKYIDTKGGCYDNEADKFLFYDTATDCHRCLVIYERHPNVIQYKENLYCEVQTNLEHMCREIPGDAPLYTLFRLDSTPQDCPFRGAPFTFTYNRGYGECQSPVSHLDTCTSNSHLLFRYQACPDVQKTESTEEELECTGHWREGSQDYLVGKVHQRLASISASPEESYRCFVFEKLTGGGYRVAQSGDATCMGVISPTDGARTLTLTKAEPQTGRCQFPFWLHAHRWQSLDGKNVIRMSSGNSSFDIERTSNGGVHGKGHRGGVGDPFSSFFSHGARVQCEDVVQVSSQQMSVQVIYIHQCKRQKLCLQIYRRDGDVLEVQPSVLGNDCTTATVPANDNLITLVNPDAGIRRCPHLGKYAARGIVNEGRTVRDTCGPEMTKPNFHALVIGCDHRETLEFYSNCPHEHSQAFACHGSWEEGGSEFLIASPLSRAGSTRRNCFTYKSDPVTGMLTVFSSGESCRRHAGPEALFAHNLTVESRCAEAVISSSSHITTSLSVISATLFVLSVLVHSLRMCSVYL